MACGKTSFVLSLLLASLVLREAEAQGRVWEPVHRGAAWRKGFKTPINYDDHMNNCGGFPVQHAQNKGKCGVCGDDWAAKQPRNNENGGYYGTGAIVQSYKVNQTIDVVVEITNNIKGYFEFSLCKLNFFKNLEDEACFNAYPLEVNGYGRRVKLSEDGKPGVFKLKIDLPKNLTCTHCILRWHYRGGNNWGVCENGEGKLGCGPQETFRTCSDVTISTTVPLS